jgi:hypothetical protein
MNVTTDLRSARATRVMCTTVGDKAAAVYATPEGPKSVYLTGFSGPAALALLNAIERLLNGATIFDAGDLSNLREHMRIAHGTVAGQDISDGSTVALGAIERAMRVVS